MPAANPDPKGSPVQLTPEQTRMIAILGYLHDWDKLNRAPIASVRGYNAGLLLFESEIKSIPAVALNLSAPDGEEVWMEIPRLSKTFPPPLPEALCDWVILSDDPAKPPKHRDNIEIFPDPKSEELEPEVLEFSLGLEEQFDGYVEDAWTPWADDEVMVRRCIALYEKVFHLQQTIETAGTETPVEVVWGMAMAVWNREANKICHPLITQQVEILPLEGDMTLRLRPTSREPKLETDPFLPLEIPELPHFDIMARALLEEAEITPSPFDTSSFYRLAMLAAGHLDTSGRFWPEDAEYVEGELPAPSDSLIVSDSWVLFARKRSTNFLVDDLRRLQEAIEEEGVPEGASHHLVEEPEGISPEPVEVNFRGLSTAGASGEGCQELYFPKPFNAEQVEIIHRLDSMPGVIVQGPPGTGKTHTIANVICHYLALGKRVLVTSKGETALSVLQEQIPEQIRHLTVSLLTNERKGKEQLERAVNNINSKLSTLRPTELKREIKDLDQEIDILHGRISLADSKLRAWAKKNTENSPAHLGGLLPEILAREVVGTESAHGWFPDSLDARAGHEPDFPESDVDTLSSTRRSLGDKLQYANMKLPAIDDLPTPAEIPSIHENLIEQDQLEDEMENSVLPRLPSDEETMLSAAEGLLNEIRQHRRLVAGCEDDWLQKLRGSHQEQLNSPDSNTILDSLDRLVAELTALHKKFSTFSAIAISLPEKWLDDENLMPAIHNASCGRRPFGITPFGAKATRQIFAAIRIDGSSPKDVEEWKRIYEYCEILGEAQKNAFRWNKLAGQIGGPNVPLDPESCIPQLARHAQSAADAKTLALNYDSTLSARLCKVFPALRTELISTRDGTLEQFEKGIEIQLRSRLLARAKKTRTSILSTCNNYPGDLFTRMAQAIGGLLGDSEVSAREIEDNWASLLQELSKLHSLTGCFATVVRVTGEIERCGASTWAELLRSQPASAEKDALIPENWKQSWRWSQQRGFLDSIDGRSQILTLTAGRRDAEIELRRAYEAVVEKRTWLRLVEQLRLDKAISRGITAYVQAIRSMAKSGKGKRDGKLRHAAREAMHYASRGVPCWIMPHWRISESLPARLADFDLVIVDEASQSDAWAIPAVIRGKKVLIVGDDKQVGPQPSFTRQGQIDQIQERLKTAGVPSDIRSRLDPKESIYDLGELIFSGQTIRLREHFRCAEPIIEFSNRLCYDGEIKCVRVPKSTERLLPTLVDVHVTNGYRDQIRKVNRPEAEAVIDEIEQLVGSDRFGKRTIGVVSLLGPDQAKYIFDGTLERIGEEAFLKHKIRCGDARTFQGSEADVIFISCVDDGCSGAVMTANKLDNIRRINVAVSRARDRLYLFHSFARTDLSELDLRGRLMDHFKSPLPDLPDGNGRELCESGFELEMFDSLTEMGYRTAPQVAVGNYRIDFVVEGEAGRRLAIECDGDRYHGPEKWMEDMARQRVLERAGWKFWRCWGSSFARDRRGCLDELKAALNAEEIFPSQGVEQDFSSIVEFREIGDSVETDDATDAPSPDPEFELEADDDPRPDNDWGAEQETDESESAVEESTPHVRTTWQASSALAQESGELFGEDSADLPILSNQLATGPRASVGDQIRFYYLGDEEDDETVVIVDTASNPDLGFVNSETPVAKGLLGSRVGDECEIRLPGGIRKAIISRIDSRH